MPAFYDGSYLMYPNAMGVGRLSATILERTRHGVKVLAYAADLFDRSVAVVCYDVEDIGADPYGTGGDLYMLGSDSRSVVRPLWRNWSLRETMNGIPRMD